MSHIKTAVSIDEILFDQVTELARKMKISRSRLFMMALNEFVKRHESARLLEKLDKAYEKSDPDERKRLGRMKRVHRKVVEGEW